MSMCHLLIPNTKNRYHLIPPPIRRSLPHTWYSCAPKPLHNARHNAIIAVELSSANKLLMPYKYHKTEQIVKMLNALNDLL